MARRVAAAIAAFAGTTATATAAAAAPGVGNSLPSPSGSARPLRVVASFSILADIARNVAGPAVRVESLVGPDSDAHVFEPTPRQARAVAEADLVVVNGLGFEGWLPRLVTASGYRGPVLVASDGISPRRIGDAPDPHVWQSLAHAQRMVANITRALARAAPASASGFEQRGSAYALALASLDRDARPRIDAIPRARRRIVTSHDAFGYLGEAYGIDILAPLAGSTASEPSAATVARLAQQIRRESIRAVFLENISDPRLISRIAREGGAALGGKLYSDALSPPGSEADTYVKLYQHNVETIIAALGMPRAARSGPA